MSDKIDWSGGPIALPGGAMLPHLSARMRTAVVDQVFVMTGGTERLADWATKNYGDFITKVWAKGMAKPISVEVQDSDSLEAMLTALDGGEHAKVINPDGSDVTLEDIVAREVERG